MMQKCCRLEKSIRSICAIDGAYRQARRSRSLIPVNQQAAARHSRFGLGKFSHRHGRHLQSFTLQACACAGVVLRMDHGSAEREGIRSVRLRGIDRDGAVSAECHGVHPVRIEQQEAVGDAGDTRLQVQTATELDRDHLVAEWTEQFGQLIDSGAVAARREPDVDLATCHQYVAAVERAGRLDVSERPMGGKGRSRRCRLRTPGHCAGTGNDRDLAENDRSVLDEYAVG